MLFVRRESFQEFIRYYPVVTGIAAINTVLFLLSFIQPIYQYIYGFGLGYNLLVAEGQLWRLLTPVFLHGGFSHFLFNTFSLVIFAPALERMLGSKRFLTFYLLAGIAGNVGTFFVAGLEYRHLGASGAIYGLLGMYLYMVLHRQDLIDHHSAQVIKMMLIIGVIYSFIMPGINVYAHFFGFVAGLAAGHLIFKKQVAFSGHGSYEAAVRKQQEQQSPKLKVRKVGSNVFSFEPDYQKTSKNKKLIFMLGAFFTLVIIYMLVKGFLF